jgi:hypothetical protein
MPEIERVTRGVPDTMQALAKDRLRQNALFAERARQRADARKVSDCHAQASSAWVPHAGNDERYSRGMWTFVFRSMNIRECVAPFLI